MSQFEKIMNKVPALILRSPLHRMMSGKYAVIRFTGRKSGRSYATPMAYVQRDRKILMTTDSGWWRNFAPDAPVTLVLRGKTVDGTAHLVQDPGEACDILRALLDAIPSYAKPAGLNRANGTVSDGELERAVEDGRRAIVITI